jgi:signal transduction histidine kinase
LENLLTWSRLQRGKADYTPRDLPLGLLAADVLSLFQVSAEQKQITFRNAIPRQLKAYGDLKMVKTVMRNLVANALKFTHPGGTITLEAHQEKAAVSVAVSDTGIGIPTEHLPDLFQIETKFRREGTHHEKGTGLGLLLCKEFVEHHNGRISIESEVGRGTTVRFSLPQAAS